jgi:hypothetical protein
MLAEFASYIAVVLFEFECLIKPDGNKQGKKNHLLRRKFNIQWNPDLRFSCCSFFCGPCKRPI